MWKAVESLQKYQTSHHLSPQAALGDTLFQSSNSSFSHWVSCTRPLNSLLLQEKKKTKLSGAQPECFFFLASWLHADWRVMWILGGSYQEALQTEPRFPRFASNTANKLCSDTEPCVKLTKPRGKNTSDYGLQVMFAAQEMFFANLLFSVNISRALWQQWCMWIGVFKHRQ